MKRKSFFRTSLLALLILLFALPVLGQPEDKKDDLTFVTDPGPDWAVSQTIEPEYAKHFRILYFENGCKLIALSSGESYLYLPEGEEAPEDLDPAIRPLPGPLDRIFLTHTSAMSFFDELDALDALRFASLPADGWFIDGAHKAMEEDEILFAGKYREPDFELLTAEDCHLVIFNNGIRIHDKVLAMADTLDLPWFIDISADENHPLGKLEWIKVYGTLLDKDEAADTIFQEQKEAVEKVEKGEDTDLRVALFEINKDGDILTRKKQDYLVNIMEIAGGNFVIEDTKPYETKSSLVKMNMEDFYLEAKDADMIIYNGTTHGHPESLDAVLNKNPILADFKAVQNDQCYSIGKNLFQETSKMAQIISEFRYLFTQQAAPEEGEFLQKLSWEKE